jgi:hypothetical protein
VKLVAMCCFWNEPAKQLERLIPSLPGICDRIVALDGGYVGQPGATRLSPLRQRNHLTRLCKEHGLTLELHQPARVWDGEVEKRSALAILARDDADWLYPADGDWEFVGDKRLLRRSLAELDRGTVGLDCYFYTPPPKRGQTVPHTWHQMMADNWQMYPVFHRALAGFDVRQHHWWYVGHRDGRWCSISGAGHRWPQGKRVELRTRQFAVWHHCFTRTRQQLEDRRRFYKHRDALVASSGRER